ncbi:transposase [Desulfonatronum parangueonense]
MGYPLRFFVPGYVWHITHRCHNRDFLLDYAWYLDLWVKWLQEGRARYNVPILNFSVTSNHFHLLVVGPEDREAIPRMMQLVASRVGARYNKRRGRKGAFWEKRYHATGVETDEYLARCSLYIDLNMNRAGVVDHPRTWKHCGYHEIVKPKQRYRLIAVDELVRLMGMPDTIDFSEHYSGWVANAIRKGSLSRDEIWTVELAVGSKSFVDMLRLRMGADPRKMPVAVAHENPGEYGVRANARI